MDNSLHIVMYNTDFPDFCDVEDAPGGTGHLAIDTTRWYWISNSYGLTYIWWVEDGKAVFTLYSEV